MPAAALPAVDAHAHIKATVPARDLLGLQACVFAVTRSISEWESSAGRRDPMALWGVGTHPGVKDAVRTFDERAFTRAAERALLIGEVGLDGRARVPGREQAAVFDAVLRIAGQLGRPVSVHSTAASAAVLEALERHPAAARTVVLHWWRGTPQETERAVQLGCFFSVNGAEAKNPAILDSVPVERLLTETDFPHTRRIDDKARRPAATGTIESALAQHWGMTVQQLRGQLWRNLGTLFGRCDLTARLPARVQQHIASA